MPSRSSLTMPDRSPLYEARHAPRYERQKLIRRYEKEYKCRLVILIDALFPHSVTLLEETLHDADFDEDLHIILATPGGDGETAIRLIRQAQSRCSKLTVIVPDQAKSAGTLFVLGADQICMGPTSDLGPVDPQFLLSDGSLAAGRAIIAAVEDAERRIEAIPQTYALHASLLADISALMVQQARDAIARAGDQIREALACVESRKSGQLDELAEALDGPLLGEAQSHATTISADDACEFGLPVRVLSSDDQQWKSIWRLWTKYTVLNALQVYEGAVASYVVPQSPGHGPEA